MANTNRRSYCRAIAPSMFTKHGFGGEPPGMLRIRNIGRCWLAGCRYCCCCY
jgi:hypothetical protein